MNVALTTPLRQIVRRVGQESPVLARYLPRVGVIDAALPNGHVMRMWSKGDDDVTSAVYWGGWAGHEREIAGLFWERAQTARVVLDIGAHVGYFSLLAALANPAAKVHSFEPLALVHQRLRYNVSLNNLENVSCHELAVGELPGRERFYHLPDCIPSSSSLSRPFMEPIVGDRSLVASEVDVTSVDEFVARHALTGVDLVKLDTEGTEDSVIAGMVRTIADNRPTLFCEVLPGGPAGAIEEILASFDYRFYLLTDTGARPRTHITPHHKWRNQLFRPAEPPPDQPAGDSRRKETDDADA